MTRRGHLESLSSILVVLDRGAGDVPLVANACSLAQYTGARIDLFSCDAPHEYELRRAYVGRGVESARQASVKRMRDYLQPFAEQIAVRNLAVSVEVASDSPLYEGIVHQVLMSRPGLVMKTATSKLSGAGEPFSSDTDWQLVRACPAPLLLGRGVSWPPRPRFAAMVDVSHVEKSGLAAIILQTTAYLRSNCGGGEIEVLFDERDSSGEREREAHAARLKTLHEQFHFDVNRIRILTGDAMTVLPAFAAQQRYDIVVLGALTHHEGPTELVGTLTHKALKTINCDFVLVKAGSFVTHVSNPSK